MKKRKSRSDILVENFLEKAKNYQGISFNMGE